MANLSDRERLALRYLRPDCPVYFDGPNGPEAVSALCRAGLAVIGSRPGEGRLTPAGERLQAAIQDEVRRDARRRGGQP